jgi:site-specific DNA-methyltransferase (adenine-specific)
MIQIKTAKMYNMDCMDFMADIPDNYYDLACVDPPYGINVNMNAGRKTTTKSQKRITKKWDNEAPKLEYFQQLFRISKNQIIWGANYFINYLPISKAWIFWDKCVAPECSFSDGELAWTSFNKSLKKAVIPYSGFIGMEGEKFHPTTKPIKLYDWIYHNYLPQGGKVIDTHAGSQSNTIAALKAGNIEIDAIELDKEYFDKSVQRVKDFAAQLTMF